MSMPPPPKSSTLPPGSKGKGKFAWSAFAVSVILHLTLLLLVGGLIIIERIIPRTPFIDDGSGVTLGQETAMPQEEAPLDSTDAPEAVSDPTQTPEASAEGSASNSFDVLVSNVENPTFTFSPSIGPSSSTLPSLSQGTGSGQQGEGAASSGRNAGPGGLRNMASLFGSKTGGSDTLTGHFYDLKQNPKGDETVMGVNAPGSHDSKNDIYAATLSNFLQTWDEKILQQYYCAKDTLHTTQIFVPILDAREAPKAFDVERKVTPNRWLIHYKGTYTAPKSGTFRFVGVGDDVLFVRFDNKMVLNGSVFNVPGFPSNFQESLGKFKIGDLVRDLKGGEWFRLRRGKEYPIEIIIGEIPGGQFAQFLTLMEEKKKYEQRGGLGGPLLPVFQTAPTELPRYKPEGDAPAVLTPVPEKDEP